MTMTTEEFHGHFMALMHGPRAGEVAAAVLEAALRDENAKDILCAFVMRVAHGMASRSSFRSMVEKRLTGIEIMVMAAESQRGESPGDILGRVALRRAALGGIRDEFYRTMIASGPGKEALRVLGLLGFELPPGAEERN